jgi:hypothetical protein
MACKFLVAGVLGTSLLLSSAAFANVVVVDLGPLDPPDGNAFGAVNTTGSFMDAGKFSLSVPGVETAVSATIAVFSAGAFTPGTLSLFEGSPFTGSLIQTTALAFAGSAYTASFTDKLGPGAYYEEITGTVNVPVLGIGGTVTTSSAIPEPSTWVMLALGFAGLGYAAVRRSAKDKAVLAI